MLDLSVEDPGPPRAAMAGLVTAMQALQGVSRAPDVPPGIPAELAAQVEQVIAQGQHLVAGCVRLHGAIDSYARGLEAVELEMDRARSLARSHGLLATPNGIREPTAQDPAAAAYRECREIVERARDLERAGLATFLAALRRDPSAARFAPWLARLETRPDAGGVVAPADGRIARARAVEDPSPN